MGNIRCWLESVEKQFGEQIEAIVVGQHDDRRYSSPPWSDENIVLSREVGLAKLDLDYNSGYGSANCYPMYAWTKSKVFLIHEYDGATGLVWVPRQPMDLAPQFGGQCE